MKKLMMAALFGIVLTGAVCAAKTSGGLKGRQKPFGAIPAVPGRAAKLTAAQAIQGIADWPYETAGGETEARHDE